jgi:glycosyltransferase involved in cell wall biosynthesis
MEPGGARRLWVIVTCMGRLSYLKRTLPSVLTGMDATYCLVDYSCPDRSGDWVQGHYAEECGSGRIEVVRSGGHETFHKAAALNLGAHHATQRGAEYLCFLDADTLVYPALGAFVHSNLEPRQFLVALHGRSLFGFLVVPARELEAQGGFDESIVGYGGEDIEMRLRLHLVAGLSYVDAPLHSLHGIQHRPSLRTAHYSERNQEVSNDANLFYVRERVRAWTGKELFDLAPDVVRLYRRPPDPIQTTPAMSARERRRVVLRARLRMR